MTADHLPLAVAIGSAIAVAALAIGAATDIAHRQIPNSVSISVALASIPLLATLPPKVAAAHLGLALLMFGLGAAAFSRRLVGGGDVKLLAATMLWAGTALFSLVIVILSLASVAIAVIMLLSDLLLRRTPHRYRAPHAGLAADPAVASVLKAPLPLGLAIAIAGVCAIVQRAAILSPA